MQLVEQVPCAVFKLSGAGAGDLAREATQKGMRTLAEHGQMLVNAGITSAAEITRVTAG